VLIQDASGRTVTSATSVVTVALGTNPAGGTLSGTTTANAVNGEAIFDGLSINKAATGYTLVASSGALVTDTSAPFTITPAAAAKVIFIGQPNDGTAGVALAPEVAVAIQDAFGNSAPSATSAVTVGIGTNPNGGTLSGTKTVNAANGVASFPGLSINKAASGYTLVASAGALITDTSAPFTITPAAAATLLFIVQPPTFAERAQYFAPAVEVAIRDSFNNTVVGSTDPVTLSLGNPGGGTLGGTTTVNASAGVATFADLSIDRPGTAYALLAASGTLTSATSAPFGIRFVFTGVSVGGDHTCGVTVGGAAYCWGDNTNAELGDGTRTSRLSPVPVSGGVTFATVSAGGYYTCGVTTSGAAYCWGANDVGQLGDGTTTDRLTPVPVSEGLAFVAVSAGDHHTCGVTTNGAAYCWGQNNTGQLGNGGTGAGSSSPVLVSGGLAFVAVSAGFFYTCGVTTSGAAYCWGTNTNAQLGYNTGTQGLSPVPVPVSGGLTFETVSAGAARTCGVTTGGAAYCWGSQPSPVPGGVTFAAANAGAGYACGVTTGNAAYCWGENGFGQLGDGTNVDRDTPVPVSGGLAFAAVTTHALSLHTCGVTTGGAAYCWGAGGSFTPARVAL
jgi:alpha-tubulin suppressor-like RCC1 family protein